MYRCDEARKLLYPYLDNELGVKDLLNINRHLKECPSCFKYFLDEAIFLKYCSDSFSHLPDKAPSILKKTPPESHPINFFSKIIDPLFVSLNKLLNKINVSPLRSYKGKRILPKLRGLGKFKGPKSDKKEEEKE